ncbi:hypothetical protein DES53_102813 [Roseimicrobium gellanilyticum]|uniref:Uncharacterized protein n=1 Tax=Roseimicrobium gellanilyticum TaxID=748857 RepID=A0A366HRW8_9BACT|nr:hypothetical protein DES53_102813 [Roseimicrobium gellanilyticum]
MSSSSSKPSVTCWSLAVLSVPFLYLLSVPVVSGIMLEPQWVTRSTFKGTAFVADGWMLNEMPPGWLQAYRRPYHWLTYNTPLRIPLEGYSDWCWRMLEKKSP